MQEHEVIAGDGRTLKVLERGDPAGHPVLVHNGTPSSRLLSNASVASAQQRGIRLIAYDRPGYGGSSPQPGRTVADCAQDVRAIAGALRIDRLGVWGVSGVDRTRSPALRCCRISCLPWACWPPSRHGVPRAGLLRRHGQLNIDDTQRILDDPVQARVKCENDRQEMLAATLPETLEFMRSLLAPVDAALMTGELGQFCSIRCIRPGPRVRWLVG